MWSLLQTPFKNLDYNLIHFMPLVTFYTPWKDQETIGFHLFSEGIEKTSGMKWVKKHVWHVPVIQLLWL